MMITTTIGNVSNKGMNAFLELAILLRLKGVVVPVVVLAVSL